MSTQKRSHETVDPDYADAGDLQAKRQRALEQDAKEAVSKKIQGIVKSEFQKEINLKETELQSIDQKLNEALLQMDRLRACIVATYYGQGPHTSSSQASSVNAPPPSIHPAVKKYLGKAPKGQSTMVEISSQVSAPAGSHERLGVKQTDKADGKAAKNVECQSSLPPVLPASTSSVQPGPVVFEERHARFKVKRKIIVGNVSKYIPVDNREANDMSSHKWMVYVRGPKSDPHISSFVKKVWFFLHHSYKPNDLVEISSAPFHLTRRGWGEFPVRVQLHFVDPRNKKVDIIHHLKLDKTFTGLQTLGAETVVEVEIERESLAGAQDNISSTPSSSPSLQPLSGESAASSSIPSSQLQKSAVGVRGYLKNDVEHGQSTSSNHPDRKDHLSQHTGQESSTVAEKNSGDRTLSCSHSLDWVIKEEIIENNETHEAEGVGSSMEEEYHMTIAHEHPSDLAVKEEPDQEVDVCEDTGATSSGLTHAAKQRKVIVSVGNASVASAQLAGDFIAEVSNVSKVSGLSISLASSASSAPLQNELSSSSSSALSSAVIASTSLSVPSSVSLPSAQSFSPTPVFSVQSASPSSLSLPDKADVNKSHCLTVIKDPSKLRPASITQQTALSRGVATTPASTAVAQTSTLMTVASSVSVVTTTSTTTTATSATVTRATVISPAQYNSMTFAMPRPQTNGNAGVTVPVSLLHQQGAPAPKMVIVRPNTNLPRKVVHLVNSQKVPNNSSPVAVPTQASLQQSSGHENLTAEKKYPVKVNSSVLSQTHKFNLVSSGVHPAVIAAAHTPPSAPSPSLTVKPAAPRQVSLLTGLVVGPRPSVPQVTRNSPVTPGSSSTAAVDSQHQLHSSGKSTLPSSHVIVVSKPNITSNAPSPAQSNNSSPSSLLRGRTLLKVLNKSPLGAPSLAIPNATAAPIKIISTGVRKPNPHPRPVTLVTNIQASTNQVSHVQDTALPQCELITPTPSPQMILSLPGGATVPLTPDFHEEKMSAVGITKHGKNYRTILPPASSRKSVSQEDRLKGQYEVLRAFKENPELYRKTRKKIVIAANDLIEGEEDVIPPLDLEDYSSLRALVKAAVILHPLVQAGVNKISHPYCAESLYEWNSWAIGKQRASEWHRACFTLRYLRSCLGSQRSEFRGQQLMSTRELVDWCRCHAFSPVVCAKAKLSDNINSIKNNSHIDSEPEAAAAAAPSESFYHLQLKQQLQSFTQLDDLRPWLAGPAEAVLSRHSLEEKEGELDVVDGDAVGHPVKAELAVTEELKKDPDENDWLPPSDGAVFVHDQLRKRGIRLQPERLENGVMACLSAEVIYRTMLEFCSDVLREALAVSEVSSSEVTGQDIHRGLMKLPEAAFCCNKFLGKQDEQEAGFAAYR